MANITEIIRGDSYAEDIVNTAVLPTDEGYANWVGEWAIVDKLESATPVLATGALLKSVDSTYLRLQARILPDDTFAIPVGTYKLIIQVTNTTLGFNKEVVQRTLKILPQGV